MSQFNFEQWRNHVPAMLDAKQHFAVLVPVVCAPEPALLFEVRAGSLRRQPGEICFPGGKIEAGESPQQCALRETWEELGIAPACVDVVAELDFLCLPASFQLHPILGRLNQLELRPEQINSAEVAETFLVPVSFFQENPPELWSYPLRPDPPKDFPYERTNIPRNYPWRSAYMEVPIYLYEGRTIWGMTARIVKHLFPNCP